MKHILRSMRILTIAVAAAVLAWGCSDGNDPEKTFDLDVKFTEPSTSTFEVVYFHAGNRDAGALSAWIGAHPADVYCLAGAAGMTDVPAGYRIVSAAGMTILSAEGIAASELLEADGVEVLCARIGNARIAVCDFGADAPVEVLNGRFEALLDATFNNPEYMQDAPRWFLCGSFHFCSSMDCNRSNRPEWYPSGIDSEYYAADLSAWNNGLKDGVATRYGRYVPTFFDPVSGRDSRSDYIYVSDAVWQNLVEAEVIDDPFTAFLPDVPSHRPVRYEVRYDKD